MNQSSLSVNLTVIPTTFKTSMKRQRAICMEVDTVNAEAMKTHKRWMFWDVFGVVDMLLMLFFMPLRYMMSMSTIIVTNLTWFCWGYVHCRSCLLVVCVCLFQSSVCVRDWHKVKYSLEFQIHL